jgi:beta-glucanase (GH16 family)
MATIACAAVPIAAACQGSGTSGEPATDAGAVDAGAIDGTATGPIDGGPMDTGAIDRDAMDPTAIDGDAMDSGTLGGRAMTEAGPSDGAAGTEAAASPWVPLGYTLVFSDEFDESALDTSKWWTRFVYGGGTLDRLNDEKERYREHANHVMTGSSIKLMGYKVGTSDPAGVNYESGMLRSKTTVRYGYVEARVKMPPGVGSWPAFWLNPEDVTWPPEIDIFEFVNNGIDDKPNMIHSGVIDHGAQGSGFLFADPNFNKTWTFWTAPFDFPADFHVVAALWDQTSVATFVDGKMIVQRGYQWLHDDGGSAGYAHVLLNYAIGGAWAGRYGIDDSAFPQGLEIDYVRVYQKTIDVSTSTTGHELCPTDGGC